MNHARRDMQPKITYNDAWESIPLAVVDDVIGFLKRELQPTHPLRSFELFPVAKCWRRYTYLVEEEDPSDVLWVLDMDRKKRIRGLIQVEGSHGRTHLSRRLGLKGLVNNDRFLILPWVKAPHLASFLLGRICRRLAQDWQRVYQEAIVLAETFVDSERFAGTCYRAANWLCLGKSRGRGRNDRDHEGGAPIKSVWVYPLKRDFCRSLLEAPP